MLAMALAPIASAQQADDKGTLARWLEDALSDAGRRVEITGFTGALSSNARIERMTIADAQGVWITVHDAQLVWRRAALLAGQVEVDTLTAARIDLPRLPAGDPDAPPQFGAQPFAFAFPELSTQVAIGRVAVAEIRVGAAVAGQPFTLRADGSVLLDGGAGRVALRLDRTDGREGNFTLAAARDGETGVVTARLTAREGAGGVVAGLAGMPDAPALSLDLNGAGPAAGFAARLEVRAGDVRVLGGDLAFAADTTGQTVSAELGGDLRPVVTDRLRAFFGPETGLSFRARQAMTGEITLDGFDLHTGQLSLAGTARTLPGGRLAEAKVSFAASSTDGTRVELPVADTSLGRAALDLVFDTATARGWRVSGEITDLLSAGLTATRVTLSGSGPVDDAGFVSGVLHAALAGTGHTDPAIADLVGRNAAFDTAFSTMNGELALSGARLTADAATAGFDGTVRRDGIALRVDGTITTAISDLSRLSVLAGQPLGGALTTRARVKGDLLRGAFDLEATGTARDLVLPVDRSPAYLRGAVGFDVSAVRDEQGITLRHLRASGPELSVRASGTATQAGLSADASVRLADGAHLSPALAGPVRIEAKASRPGAGDAWTGEASLRHAKVSVTASGDVDPTGPGNDLRVRASGPLSLANSYLDGRSLDGDARADLRIRGRLGIGAIGGTVTLGETRFRDPAARLDLTLRPTTITLTNGTAAMDLQARSAKGGTVSARGSLAIDPHAASSLDIGLDGFVVTDDLSYTTTLTGTTRLQGAFSGGATLTGQIGLAATEIRLAALSSASAQSIPAIRHTGASGAAAATRARAGLTGRGQQAVSGPAIGLDIGIDAARGVFLRGRAVDAEVGGTIRLRGTTADIAPDGRFELVRGRLDLLGQRFDLNEGSVALRGSTDPRIDLAAETTTADGLMVRVFLEGYASAPEIRFASEPELPEDEVLARLVFGRDLAQISPLQAARLAGAIAELTGRSSGGIVERLRRSFGIDDLDVRTHDGATEFRAGKYISDNIYTEGTVGSDGKNTIQLNLDVTPRLRATGRLSTEGDTGIGLFYTRDY